MKDVVVIKDLSFKYGDKLIFDKINLNIKAGEWLSLIGPNNSGKTTLIKILAGLLETNNEILIDGMPLNKDNIKEIRKRIGIIFENVDNQFVTETVRSELAFTLENLSYEEREINDRIDEIAVKFQLEDILNCDPHNLSGGEKQKVALASVLITKPKILILDGALSMLDHHERIKILDMLKKLHREEGLTIIHTTYNLEETYDSDRIVVLNEGVILVDGPTKEVLKQDKIFNRIGLEVPFMVDLSLKLKLYGLIDNLILDMDEMVNALWK